MSHTKNCQNLDRVDAHRNISHIDPSSTQPVQTPDFELVVSWQAEFGFVGSTLNSFFFL